MKKHLIIGLLMLMPLPVAAQIIQPGLIPGHLWKCDYYAGPSGSVSNSGKVPSAPIRIGDFWALASAGKTLCLLNGTYTGAAQMITPTSGLSGTSSAPITIRALKDGGVLIDGEGLRRPVGLGESGANHWFVLEGFNAARSNTNVVLIGGGADDVIVRRVVAWDALHSPGQRAVIQVIGDRALIEDVGAFGWGRSAFSPAQGGHDVTVRRSWFRLEGSEYTDFWSTKFRYNNNRPLFENVLMTWDELSIPTGSTISAGLGGLATENWESLANKCSGGGPTTPGTRLYGSMFYIVLGQRVTSSALDGERHGPGGGATESTWDVGCADVKDFVGIAHPSHPKFSAFRALMFSTLGTCCDVNGDPGNPTAAGQFYAQPNKGRLRRLTGVGGRANMFGSKWDVDLARDVSTATTLGGIVNPFTNTGEKGARLCHRYVDGALTNTPLWPWPMNERIKQATASAGRACPTCFDRTETDVTAQIESLLGTIPATCRQ